MCHKDVYGNCDGWYNDDDNFWVFWIVFGVIVLSCFVWLAWSWDRCDDYPQRRCVRQDLWRSEAVRTPPRERGQEVVVVPEGAKKITIECAKL